MTRLSKADIEAITVGLQDIYAARDPDAYPARMLAELRKLIPSDQIGYNEINLARHRADVVPRYAGGCAAGAGGEPYTLRASAPSHRALCQDRRRSRSQSSPTF